MQLANLQRITVRLSESHGASSSKGSSPGHTPASGDNKVAQSAIALQLCPALCRCMSKQACRTLRLSRLLQGCMPGVTVILPIQGFKTHSLLNWQSQLSMQYAGPVEYIFVTQAATGRLAALVCFHTFASISQTASACALPRKLKTELPQNMLMLNEMKTHAGKAAKLCFPKSLSVIPNQCNNTSKANYHTSKAKLLYVQILRYHCFRS